MSRFHDTTIADPSGRGRPCDVVAIYEVNGWTGIMARTRIVLSMPEQTISRYVLVFLRPDGTRHGSWSEGDSFDEAKRSLEGWAARERKRATEGGGA